MLSARSRRLIIFLVLSLFVFMGCAAGAAFWLARKVPKFNQYILLVPIMKPFRYYPPEKAEKAQVFPAMPDDLLLPKEQVVSVQITALARPESVIETPPDRELRLASPPLVFIATQTLTGVTAQELALLWNSQSIDCQHQDFCCFSPSFTLDFYRDDERLLRATICWSCGRIDVTTGSSNKKKCYFYSETPFALKLSQRIHALMPPFSTHAAWDRDRKAVDCHPEQPPVSPVIFGAVTTSIPDAALLLQGEVQERQKQLAYCYEHLYPRAPFPEGSLLVEFSVLPYTEEEHQEMLAQQEQNRGGMNHRKPPILPWEMLRYETQRRQVEQVALVQTNIAEPALVACVLKRIRTWHLRRTPAPKSTPLHVRLPIEFHAPS